MLAQASHVDGPRRREEGHPPIRLPGARSGPEIDHAPIFLRLGRAAAMGFTAVRSSPGPGHPDRHSLSRATRYRRKARTTVWKGHLAAGRCPGARVPSALAPSRFDCNVRSSAVPPSRSRCRPSHGATTWSSTQSEKAVEHGSPGRSEAHRNDQVCERRRPAANGPQVRALLRQEGGAG